MGDAVGTMSDLYCHAAKRILSSRSVCLAVLQTESSFYRESEIDTQRSHVLRVARSTHRHPGLVKAFAAICRRSFFRILAVGEVGHLPGFTKTTFLGTLKAERCALHFLIISSAV
jgi:hypothetical protein